MFSVHKSFVDDWDIIGVHTDMVEDAGLEPAAIKRFRFRSSD